MLIKLNGQDRETPDGTSILALLEALKLRPQNVAVELNRRLLKTEKYDQPLKAGDELEVVTFVGGG